MMKYKTYKDSKIEWIGKLPEHWHTKKIKHILLAGNEGIKIGPFGSTLKLEFIKSSGVKIYGQENVIKDDFSLGYKYIDNEKFEELSNYQIFSGDIIVTMMGTTGKAKVVPEDIETGIMDSHLTRIRIDDTLLVPRLLELLINNSHSIAAQIKFQSKGAIMDGLNSGIIKSLYIPLPPLEEQTQIARYLDYKTAQIDQLIADKQKLIELLNEERTAMINQAVTKGLDPDVPMKDSGIEWLGEIPEHWEMKKLKYLLKGKKDALKTGPFGSHLKNSDLTEGGEFKIYTQRNVLDNDFESGDDFINVKKYETLKSFKVEIHDILLTTRGTIGRCAIFPENTQTGILHPCLIRLQVDKEKASAHWIINYINNTSLFFSNIKFNSNSTIIDVIYGYTLKEIYFPTPPLYEQEAILKFIDKELKRINDVLKNTEREIELLKEYKTALISEVVTGKVDVRNEVIPHQN